VSRARAVATLVAAWALTGCATEDVVVATFAPDGGASDGAGDEPPPGNGACASNADCGGTSFCAKSSCGDATGSCQLRPVECDGVDMRSCGCDGVTYWNDCLRQQFGVAASTEGECRIGAALCSPEGPSSCPVPGAWCERLLGQGETCGSDVPPGPCWVVPIDPTTCTGPGGNPPTLWSACGSGPTCVNACAAVQSGVPYHQENPADCTGG
jgi:hypothetical protein